MNPRQIFRAKHVGKYIKDSMQGLLANIPHKLKEIMTKTYLHIFTYAQIYERAEYVPKHPSSSGMMMFLVSTQLLQAPNPEFQWL